MPNSGAGAERTLLTSQEIRAVMSEFSSLRVVKAHAFNRGSRRFPKAVIETEDGALHLLKRRGASDEDRARTAFSHMVHAHLASKHFPVARALKTSAGLTWVLRDSWLYEAFEFLKGERFRRSVGEARESGLLLSRLHRTLRGWTPEGVPPPQGGYHRSKTVEAAWSRLAHAVVTADPTASERELAQLERTLRERYDETAAHADTLLLATAESTNRGVIHGDFHPGNLLFVGGAPVALLDFDGARFARTVVEIANGGLQFGLHSVGTRPVAQWNPALNLACVEAFITGYAWPRQVLLEPRECEAVPALMIQSAIAECVPRIAISGLLDGRMGIEILRFLEQKTGWIWSQRTTIATLCATCMARR